jgi:toxin ParE1/3/4
MSGQVRRRPEADLDLIEHYAHIDRDNLNAAERFLDEAEATFDRLVDMPKMGVEQPTRNPDLVDLRRRQVSGFRNYLIFYLPAEDGIEVVRVLHAARDYMRLFGG